MDATSQAEAFPPERRQSTDLWQLGTLPVLALGAFSGVLGVYWDIAWHTDKGRDSFFSPPHLFIYAAMLAVMVMGVYTFLRDRRDTPLHFRAGRFRLQPGVLIVTLGAALTFFFAPADELWHRLFGPDITLWGPMHLVGLLGLTLACFGGLIASWLERNLSPGRDLLLKCLTLFFATMFLAWCMLFLAEYEFGYPVFPVWVGLALLMGLPSFILYAIAKLRPLPWSGTLTALGFTAFRLLVALWLITADGVFDWAGETRPMLPLLLLTGVAADLLARRGAGPMVSGVTLGLITFLSQLPLVLTTGALNWYSGALLIGVPAGLGLSVLMSYLGEGLFRALELPEAASQKATPA